MSDQAILRITRVRASRYKIAYFGSLFVCLTSVGLIGSASNPARKRLVYVVASSDDALSTDY